jgi:hypothetical protein
MYAGCSDATCVYACCIVGKVRTCGKYVFLALGFTNRDDKFAQRNGKRLFVQDCIG